MNKSQRRFIITKGVIDMATSAILSNEGYYHEGAMALCDGDDDKIRAAIDKALEKHFEKVKDALAEHEKQMAANGRITDELKSTIAALNKDGGKLVSDQKEFVTSQNQRILDLEQKLATLAKEGAPGNLKTKGKSLGELFIESKEFTDWVGRGARQSSVPFVTKNITNLPGSGGPGIFPEYLPTPVIPNFMPLTIRDLCGQATTESNAIIWVQENVFTDNAGYQGSEGRTKAQSDINYVQQNIAVATLAHFIKASKQTLADFKLLQSLVNARLSFGLKLAEEREILFGDGAVNHLHGIVPQATAYNTGLTKAGDQMIDIIRHAMLQVQLAFYPATGIALSPSDWHDIELLKDGFHRYLFSNPAGTIPAMVWGLPVAQCYSFNGGEFLVGSFKLAVTIFDREQASILVSTEDGNNFTQNLVTILAEERLALAVSRPAAIINGQFPAQSST
jgi:HK97 family phage major capsid protein